jgi:hypothetical protein
MIDIEEIIGTISRARNNETSVNLLLAMEGILDELDIYAYKNWIHGEIIRGPIISKYWVEMYLMYPVKMMPDPAAAERLIKRGCHVFYKKDVITSTVKIKKVDDIESREIAGRQKRVPKTTKTTVYVVKLVMPRHLLNDINQNLINGLDDDVSLDDLISAYDQGLDVSMNVDDATGDTKELSMHGDVDEEKDNE